MVKHGSETFFIEGEGVLTTQLGGRTGTEGDPLDDDAAAAPPPARPLAARAAAPFRFSRMGPRGRRFPAPIARKLAAAMTRGGGGAGGVPAGYTYLGQFVDHDLTLDASTLATGGEVDPATALSGRSPRLDLDCLYGAGPGSTLSRRFYADDGVHLLVGDTQREGSLAAQPGHDLPRVGRGRAAQARAANIPDPRNDENLAVGQTHLAFLRFHNRVVDTLPAAVPASARFREARRLTTLHYQWLLRHDYLPRVCDPAVLDDVWAGGRRVFEADAAPTDVPTMPVEFSVAAFRMGHSMVRQAYNWNAVFPGTAGSLDLLFFFSGTGGDLGGHRRLVSSWVVDWRRLYDFPAAGKPNLAAPDSGLNRAMRIDTRLTDPLAFLPAGTFGGDADTPPLHHNLAFRNLVRAGLVRLASGQQMAETIRAAGVPVRPLTRAQILRGDGGADLGDLTASEKDRLVAATPLWFYVLREAELNDGVLAGVGARIVAETFHRAMEGSRTSIVREPDWRPTLGPRKPVFEMPDLLRFAFGSTAKALAPVG